MAGGVEALRALTGMYGVLVADNIRVTLDCIMNRSMRCLDLGYNSTETQSSGSGHKDRVLVRSLLDGYEGSREHRLLGETWRSGAQATSDYAQAQRPTS